MEWPLGTYGFTAGIGLGCVSIALRWYRSRGLERRQVTWVVLGGLAGPVLITADLVLTQILTGSTQTAGLHGSLVWGLAAVALPGGIAIAAATLAAAAAFQPLLRRSRVTVDRRFDRAAYDAAETVEVFARALDRQVELETIAAGLEAAVRDTVRPVSGSLWLKGR